MTPFAGFQAESKRIERAHQRNALPEAERQNMVNKKNMKKNKKKKMMKNFKFKYDTYRFR